MIIDPKRNITRQFVEQLDAKLEQQREALVDRALHVVAGSRFARNVAEAYRPEGL